MISFLVLTLVVIIGFLIMRSLIDDKRKLPPVSTPQGKRARIIAGLVLVLIVGAFILNTATGGVVGEDNVRLTLTSILIGATVVLVPLLVQWIKDKKGK